MKTDAELLADYRDTRSPRAFADLVGRHAGWVHAAARRRVGGDDHLAHDVTQAVLVLLAERPGRVRDGHRLGGWLLRTTEYAAAHAVRGERRRLTRERAVAATRPEVAAVEDADAAEAFAAVERAVGRLDESDRTLVVLRFHRGRSLAEVGAELGISADAARKRLDRTLARLKRHLLAAGSAVTPAGLSALFPIAVVSPTLSIPSRATASSRALSIVKGVSLMQTWNRIKLATAAAVATVAVAGGVLLARDGPASPPGGGTATAAADGGGGGPAVATAVDTRVVDSHSVAVVVSPDGKKLTGYSKPLGKWAQIDGDGFAVDRVTVAGDVAVYRGDDRVIAFSSVTGTWATADVPRPADHPTMVGPNVSERLAAFSVPGTTFAYSTATGTWAALATDADPAATWGVGQFDVTARANERVYFFGLQSGKWTPGF